MDKKQLTGSAGEATAARYLKRHGYTIVGQNYARDSRYIVFVEVKTRKSEAFAAAREYVTAAKQARVQKAAMLWLQSNETELQPRFDVIEVIGQGFTQKINHIENAF